MKKQTFKKPRGNYLLGVYVTHYTVDAVLLQKTETDPEIVRRFVRQRIRVPEMSSKPVFAESVPAGGRTDGSNGDATIHFGDGSSGDESAEIFLSAEFSSIEKENGGGHGGAVSIGSARPQPFESELKDILTECRDLGFGTPAIAFCIGEPHVTYVELRVQNEAKRGKEKGRSNERKGSVKKVGTRRLLRILAERYKGKIEKERVGFVQLSSSEGVQRYLAIIPHRTEPVTETLELLRKDRTFRMPPVRLVDSEMSLYSGLARTLDNVSDERTTAVIRVGLEDTLIICMKGQEISYHERVRSLTSVDSPNTVGSRILLLQDDKKVGELDTILIASERRDTELKKQMEALFPSARTELLLERTLEAGVKAAEGATGAVNSSALPALGAALRMDSRWSDSGVFPKVNLLASAQRKKKRNIEFAWHTFAAVLLLSGLSGWFAYSYVAQEREIERLAVEVQAVAPQHTQTDAATHQARLEDLQSAFDTYAHALGIVDSLLPGSDRWSRILERTATATSRVPGIWMVSMRPVDQGLRIEGNALARTRVAQLARDLGGSVDILTFSEIGEVTVYHFSMVVPAPVEMPAVALRLRELALSEVPGEGTIDDDEDHRHLEEIIVREASR